MDKNKEDKQVQIFLAICLIALGLSLIGNIAVEYFSK